MHVDEVRGRIYDRRVYIVMSGKDNVWAQTYIYVYTHDAYIYIRDYIYFDEHDSLLRACVCVMLCLVRAYD